MEKRKLLFCLGLVSIFALGACDSNPSSLPSSEEEQTREEKLKNILDVIANSDSIFSFDSYDKLEIENTITTISHDNIRTSVVNDLDMVGDFVYTIDGLLTYDADTILGSVAFDIDEATFGSDMNGSYASTTNNNLDGDLYIKDTNLYLNVNDNCLEFFTDLIDVALGGTSLPSFAIPNKFYIENAITDSMLPLMPSLMSYYDYVDAFAANEERFKDCIDIEFDGDDATIAYDLSFNDVADLLYSLEENQHMSKQEFIIELTNSLSISKLKGNIVTDLKNDKIECSYDYDLVIRNESDNELSNTRLVCKINRSFELKTYNINFPTDLSTYENVFGE